jgi:hypothetical protein
VLVRRASSQSTRRSQFTGHHARLLPGRAINQKEPRIKRRALNGGVTSADERETAVQMKIVRV